ncbi:ATP-binding protein [Streptomyces sp. ACA25]|uniref:ATP-binding protein n=1 Tax=Streptomyces sp. ACA25 TaxID=3022596 RepID=UPI002307B2B3|nr:ATP-binding protein [Streptomyces sp. ACA25]MDB1086672.1 ATP-binding protein [Streptomyces sp. ACA25]
MHSASVRSATGFTLLFPSDPRWVRNAREAMRTHLGSEVPGDPELIDTAVLLTSEVVSNAVAASLRCPVPPPVGLHCYWTSTSPGELHVLVHDRAPGVLTSPDRPAALGAEHGRGLRLLSCCARAWDIRRHLHDPGKTVWFRL